MAPPAAVVSGAAAATTKNTTLATPRRLAAKTRETLLGAVVTATLDLLGDQRRPTTASPTAASVWSASSLRGRGSWSRSCPSRRRTPVFCSCHQVSLGSSPQASARAAKAIAGIELLLAC